MTSYELYSLLLQQHDLIRAMTCLKEKDKCISELDRQLTELNATKIDLTTRKQVVSGDYCILCVI